MDGVAHAADDPADIAALSRYADALADAVDVALPGWVVRVVGDRWSAGTGEAPPASVADAARVAGEEARRDILPVLRDLLRTDVDEQRANPLALIRGAARYPTEVLAQGGLAPVDRDADAERLFPDDVYDLVPGSFGDIDPSVHEPGLEWGAAKAHVILRRRRHG